MNSFKHRIGTGTMALCLFALVPQRSEAASIHVDFSRTNGVLRPLHGVNKGPLGPGGLIDLTERQKALGIPFTRLHDCYWPNPYVVDIHAVFPDFNADPMDPDSYDFLLTDEYIAAVWATGSRIVYRLGESIEHTSVKRHVHPPANFEKWAEICLGIIRHYNEGWADGFHHGIEYWEIWNEPENRPAMWTGTDEDYFELFRTTAAAIQREFPELKIGGPAVGATGQFTGGRFQPNEFVRKFLAMCNSEGLPLSFFSWHCYTPDPMELVQRARAIRSLLDDSGFKETESHLNEWNYLPGNTWSPVMREASALERQSYFEEMAGAPGAAFIASALIELQDAPLDMASLFHGELGAFGLFNEHGVPQKNYYALLAFHELLKTSTRVFVSEIEGGEVSIAAGVNRDHSSASILISQRGDHQNVHRISVEGIPWTGVTRMEIRMVDSRHDLERVQSESVQGSGDSFGIEFSGPGVALIQLHKPAQ